MADAAPWTIKSVPVETRLKALKAAHAQDQTMAQWLADAVDRLADQQASNQVIPPGKPTTAPAPLPDLDLSGLAAAIEATVKATVAAGSPTPKALGANAAATLNRYMRAARGLAPRQTNGPTMRQNGQTALTHQIVDTTAVARSVADAGRVRLGGVVAPLD